MSLSKSFPNFRAAPILAAAMVLLAGCASNGTAPPASVPVPVVPNPPTPTPPTPPTPDPPAPPPPAPPAQVSMATLPESYVFAFTPHAGLETMVLSVVANKVIVDEPTPLGGYDRALRRDVSLSDVLVDLYRNHPDQYGTSVCTICFGSGMSISNRAIRVTGNAPSSLNYATYGAWNHNQGILNIRNEQGVFATGIPTLAADRPVSGAATYNGRTTGFATFAGEGGNFSFEGNIALTADFGANTIGGALSNLTATKHVDFVHSTATPAGSVNDIRLSSGAISGTSFAGIAAAVDAPPGAGPAVNISGASGTFGGAFYGPGAAEAAGSLALTGPSTNVIASFGAAK